MNIIAMIMGKLNPLSLKYILLIFLISIPAHSHIVKEEPWHPVPAAYLRSLFYANLKPVNWGLIEKEYSKVDKQGYQYVSVFQAFAPLKDFTGEDHTAEIKAAIDKKDRFQLYSSLSCVISS